MTSLISFYTYDGIFLDNLLSTVNITKKLKSMDSGTLVIPNTNTKLSEQLIRPGNFVVVEDDNLSSHWISIIVPPTSTTTAQTTLALIDPKHLLTELPIISTEGLGLGIISLQGIEFALSKSGGSKYKHRFTFTADENGFRFGNSPLEKNGAVHLGKSIYQFLNELASDKHFEWWLEPAISQDGVLSLRVRTQNIRKSIGNPIAIPTHGSVEGIGLAHSNKFYTAIAVISTNVSPPVFRELIEFPGLVQKYGLIIKVAESGSGVHSGGGHDSESGIGALFKELRPRRTVQLHLEIKYTKVISSLEIGSVHMVSLGNIGFSNNTRGTILEMRTIALSYNTGEDIIGIVLEEYFETDELSVLSV